MITPLKIAGVSIGFGILGESFGSQALMDAGSVSGKFIKPAINISMGGYIVKQLRKLKGLKQQKTL